MIISIKKKDLLDTMILWSLILQIVIIRWLDIHEPFNLFVVCMIAIRILKKPEYFISKMTIVPCFLFILYSIINYSILGGGTYIFFKNLYRIFKTLIILLYFICLLKHRTLFVFNFIRSKFIFFNLYFALNIPIIIAQYTGHYILLGLRQNYDRGATIDFVSGLFGVFGMPRLNLFLLFLFFMNYEYTHNRPNTFKVKLFSIYNYTIIILWLLAGISTDNKGFYICFLLYLVIYYVCQNYSKVINHFHSHFKFWNKMIISSMSFLILVITAIHVYDPFHDVYITIIDTVNQGITYMSATGGSNERFGMIAYAWSNPEYRWLGSGLANNATDETWGFGFAHFGQSDFGVYMVVGGTLFIIALIYFIWRTNSQIFGKGFINCLMVFSYLILSIYSQLFTDAALTDSFLFFQAICYFMLNYGDIFNHFYKDRLPD